MKTKSPLPPLALTLLAFALAATPTLAQNIVSNGSFELPAYPGDGDAYALDAGFTLSGWNTSGTASNGLFVEFGSHVDESGLRVTRSADGRQAVCLNDDGLGNVNGGARISQKIATVPGQNYVLSFAQADETMGAASVSQVKVTLGGVLPLGLIRTFSRTNDGPGYTVKNWHFTAGSFASVKLAFTDTTTNDQPRFSPFLDAVSVVPGSLLVAGTNVNVPGGLGQFGQLPSGPGLGGSNLVFFGAAADGQQGIYGINNYPVDPQIPVDRYKIADLNTPIPGGSGNFIGFTGFSYDTPQDPMISGNNVVFGGMGADGQQGIYSFPIGPIFPNDPVKIADLNTPIPDGEGNFTRFNVNEASAGSVSISGSNIVFFGKGINSWGIYTATLGGLLTRIADNHTVRPSGTGYLCCYNSSPIHTASPSISGNNIVFYAQSTDNVSGVYLSTGGILSTVADTTTAIPGGLGNFGVFIGAGVFPDPLVSGNTVLFYGAASFGQPGLYMKYANDPVKVVADVHTAIPGGSGNFTDFSELSLSGDAVAFVGLGGDGQQGIYVAVPTDPMMKVIDLNDILDGKTITGFQLSRTGLDRDHNRLAFGATFSDGTQGLYTLSGGFSAFPGDQGGAVTNYTIVDLGTVGGPYEGAYGSGACAINNSGQIVGFSLNGQGVFRPAFWNSSRSPAAELRTVGGGDFSTALGINDSGQIVGYDTWANESRHATFWASSSSPPRDLGNFGPNTSTELHSEAQSINNSGQIVGHAEGSYQTEGGTSYYSPAAYWTNSSSLPYPLSSYGNGSNSGWANAISDLGEAAGYGESPGWFRSVVWTTLADSAGELDDVKVPSIFFVHSEALAINASGEMAGYSDDGHAIFWNDSRAARTVLGGLGEASADKAQGINASGQIVGSSYTSQDPGFRAVLWTNSTSPPMDLNSLLPANSGWLLKEAAAINDSGEIVGYGTIGGQNHAFALIAPPPPLRITAVVRSGNGLQFSFPSQAGRTYSLLSASDLGSAPWLVRQSGITGNGGTVQVAIPEDFDQPQQFYRVQQTQ